MATVGEQAPDEQARRDRESEARAAQLGQLTEERDELRRQLAVVYSSKSWTLTAPLRKLVEISRAHVRGRAPVLATPSSLDEDRDLPPPDLRMRVAGTDDGAWFRTSGEMAVADISAALAGVGRSLDEFARVYDFGCGCGRISLPLTAIVPQASLTATDVDSEATEWLGVRLPAARVQANSVLPPLPFAENSFDLIIAWSIFTHLPEDYQDAWLGELARVLSPGGVMLQTVHGPTHFDLVGAAADDPARNALPVEGIVYFENYGPDSPFGSYYQTTFHHPDYIRGHWSKWVDVLDILPGEARPTHDMVVTAAR